METYLWTPLMFFKDVYMQACSGGVKKDCLTYRQGSTAKQKELAIHMCDCSDGPGPSMVAEWGCGEWMELGTMRSKPWVQFLEEE